MSRTIIHYKKIQSSVLALIPQGHLIAASSLTMGLMTFIALAPSEELPLSNSMPLTTNDHVVAINNQASPKQHFELPNTNALFTPIHVEHPKEEFPAEPAWQELVVKSGDNLSSMFAKAGLNDRDLYELFDGSKSAKDLRKIVPGQKMIFLVDNQGNLQELKYIKNALDSLNFARNSTGFSSKTIALKPEVRLSFRQGTITSSLFMAGKQAGLPNILTMELANVFGYDIDFALDLQKGDQFKVMFEEQYLNGEKIGTGAILSAEFTNDGKSYRAVRYTNNDGVTRYFTPDGKGMNKAFLRTPIEFARISSQFSLGRMHPVLHTMRAHKGTDYAASTGTPIRATGDGKIILAGHKGGFGNCVIIQHGQGYETLYGHMSKFGKGISSGTRVSQGQIIGYVGKTGLASGPHLHYEFHVNGAVRNPVTVSLPQAIGIAANEKNRFELATKTLLAQLDDLDRNSRLAMTEGNSKSN